MEQTHADEVTGGLGLRKGINISPTIMAQIKDIEFDISSGRINIKFTFDHDHVQLANSGMSIIMPSASRTHTPRRP